MSWQRDRAFHHVIGPSAASEATSDSRHFQRNGNSRALRVEESLCRYRSPSVLATTFRQLARRWSSLRNASSDGRPVLVCVEVARAWQREGFDRHDTDQPDRCRGANAAATSVAASSCMIGKTCE